VEKWESLGAARPGRHQVIKQKKRGPGQKWKSLSRNLSRSAEAPGAVAEKLKRRDPEKC